MILDASQRGSCKEMGRHLLNREQNDHVEVHEVRGFVANDVEGAMYEVDAMARGTRATQPLFSVSLSPPSKENVRVEVFESAIDRIEAAHGLTGQPRVIVFHEKEGRRHCHAVWSRIDADTMTAIPLPYFKMKLREISRELYIEHGWQMPRGLMNSKERDPRNFTLDQWQQAKRIGRDARDLRGIVQECYAVSDSRQAFAKALEERGLYLAKGDRRAHVAVTYEGEVISMARYTGKKSKEIEAKLGKAADLPGVDDTRARIANVIVPKLQALREEADQAKAREVQALDRQRLEMTARHALERARMDAGQQARCEAENVERAARMRSGLRGLWDTLRGETARLRKANEMAAYLAMVRDREQRQSMIAAQMAERQTLQQSVVRVRHQHAERISELHRDITRQMATPEPVRPEPSPTPSPAPDRLSERFARMSPQGRRRPRELDRRNDPSFDLDR